MNLLYQNRRILITLHRLDAVRFIFYLPSLSQLRLFRQTRTARTSPRRLAHLLIFVGFADSACSLSCTTFSAWERSDIQTSGNPSVIRLVTFFAATRSLYVGVSVAARWFVQGLQRFWQTSETYNPVPALEKIKIPILAYWGENETYIPAQESINVFKQAMTKAGNKDFTIKLIPNGRHDLIEGDTGSPSAGARMKKFPAGFWKMQIDWLLKQASVFNSSA